LTVLAVRATLGWLGPGRVVDDPVVVSESGRVLFAGPAAELGVVAAMEGGEAERLSGRPAPPEPEEELRVDGFLMPGVVDRHVHIGLSDPMAVVAGGVTAVRDLAWPADVIFSLAEASESPSFQGPLIRAAGPMLTCPRGYPSGAGWAPRGTGLEVRGSEEAAGAARDLLARGASVLKVALNAEAGPTLSDDELVAICDVAHAAGTIATAHIQGKGQAARALGAGVDEFAHCPWSERLPDDLIRAAAKQVRIVSTLDILSYGRDTPELRTATENLNRFLAAGGRVAYGTDLGNGPIPPGIHVGEAGHLAHAGLSVPQVLAALTFRPLARGEAADLVVVAGNPMEDLGALAHLRLVLRAGRRMR
jgi:imidazolonepropionase-like amidohydrolase